MKLYFPKPLLCLVPLCLASCGATKVTPVGGKFSGEPHLVSIGPNQFFFHQPKEVPAFSFTTSKERVATAKPGSFRAELRNLTITPEPMFTTGASVPRNLWYVPGLGAFDYARAAIIHDWLYEAHHRLECAKMQTNQELIDRYKAYENITQDDAADIYAECIFAIMRQSDELRKKLKDLRDRQDAESHTHERLDELASSLKAARTHDFFLSAHRWTTSTRFPIPVSKHKWDAKHDDLKVYHIISNANASSYVSPWLIGEFTKLGEMSRLQEAKFQKKLEEDAKVQASGQQLRPRIYLETPDRAVEAALAQYKDRINAAGYDLKSAQLSSSVDADELTIVYYNEAEHAHAEALLNTIKGLVAPGGKVPSGKLKAIDANSLKIKVRPLHFDVRVGTSVAAALNGPAAP